MNSRLMQGPTVGTADEVQNRGRGCIPPANSKRLRAHATRRIVLLSSQRRKTPHNALSMRWPPRPLHPPKPCVQAGFGRHASVPQGRRFVSSIRGREHGSHGTVQTVLPCAGLVGSSGPGGSFGSKKRSRGWRRVAIRGEARRTTAFSSGRGESVSFLQWNSDTPKVPKGPAQQTGGEKANGRRGNRPVVTRSKTLAALELVQSSLICRIRLGRFGCGASPSALRARVGSPDGRQGTAPVGRRRGVFSTVLCTSVERACQKFQKRIGALRWRRISCSRPRGWRAAEYGKCPIVLLVQDRRARALASSEGEAPSDVSLAPRPR